ncbi:mitochondrial inner membrane protein OXA1L-like [Panonychus citri]|uniref:mitochondrial inner membrane protein OXA1L-like n=1 Tax=Panonychus citri TaxID=50023 RepID=UPI0023080BE5|nr:mitochondrial inner membrane protein OXA1L-like [Panonychus citri]
MSSLIVRNVPRLIATLNRTNQINRFALLNCRLASSSVPSRQINLPDFKIPDPPLPPELLPLGPITAKTFNCSLWFPTGWICTMLLYLENHVPYYVAIMTVTLVGRIILTPVMIFSQKQSTKMALASPKLTTFMNMKKEAEARGDREAALKATYKLAEVYKTNDSFKLKNMVIAPLCSISVFGSFFIALRAMANSGHEVMKEGGFGPIFDLTIPDPSYLIPTWTAVTLFGIMKIGVEYGSITNTASQSPVQDLLRKASLFVIPGAIFYASTKMPAAVCLYWATSNTISICQSVIMLNPKVRRALKIPPTVKKDKSEKKGVWGIIVNSVTDVKKAWTTMMQNRTARKINNEYLNQFDRSGVGPLQKTYDYDPTKSKPKL